MVHCKTQIWQRILVGAALSILALPPNLEAAQFFNQIYYLCAAWGPDLGTKEPDKADEVIYFVKKIDFTMGQSEPGEKITEPSGPRERVWFCQMNWDGSNKREICELWAGQGPGIATESGTMWLDVSPKAKKATFSVEYGNGVCFGLWIIDLDGKNLRRLAVPQWTDKDKRAYVHPSGNPDGTEVVFSAVQHEPSVRPGEQSRLGIVNVKTGDVHWLTEGPKDDHPSWSPNGDWIVYTHYKQYTNRIGDRRIYLIRPDGSEKKPILGEAFGKKDQELFGWWPSWSTDGKWIYSFTGNPFYYISDATTARVVVGRSSAHGNIGMAQLGRRGIVNSGLGVWVVTMTSPNFEAKEEINVGDIANVPANFFGDVSTDERKWGTLRK